MPERQYLVGFVGTELQMKMQEVGYRFENEIKEINYLDPFDVKEEW